VNNDKVGLETNVNRIEHPKKLTNPTPKKGGARRNWKKWNPIKRRSQGVKVSTKVSTNEKANSQSVDSIAVSFFF
jgi:hypothetical protein